MGVRIRPSSCAQISPSSGPESVSFVGGVTTATYGAGGSGKDPFFKLAFADYRDGTGIDINAAAIETLATGFHSTLTLTDPAKEPASGLDVQPNGGAAPVLFVFGLLAILGAGVAQKFNVFAKWEEQTPDTFHLAPH